MSEFRLKIGLDLPINGIPQQTIHEGATPKSVAVVGSDYNGLKPRMLVAEGDEVVRGTPLFFSQGSAEHNVCFALQRESSRGHAWGKTCFTKCHHRR